MAKLYIQNRGQEPVVAASGDRKAVGGHSCLLARKARKAGATVHGCVAGWQVVNPNTGTADVVAWVEFSASHIATASIPDFCRAPEGAPQ